MPFFLVVLAIFMIKGDRKNWFTKKQFDNIKKILIAVVLLNVFGTLSPVLMIGSIVLSPILIPALVIALVKKSKKKQNARVDESYKGSFNQRDNSTGLYHGENDWGTMGKVTTNLPKAASKRRKIVEKFNKKFDLTLTEEQIQRIVDASYYSQDWASEIEDMTKEYTNVYEWYQGKTGWLRAYIKAFIVQSISSDFQQQKDICLAEIDQVFADAKYSGAVSQSEWINCINNKFFTEFDDVSFMIAYRFLERCGKKYELGNKGVLKNESETDILARKYDQMPSH